jgi:hypothetical protein
LSGLLVPWTGNFRLVIAGSSAMLPPPLNEKSGPAQRNRPARIAIIAKLAACHRGVSHQQGHSLMPSLSCTFAGSRQGPSSLSRHTSIWRDLHPNRMPTRPVTRCWSRGGRPARPAPAELRLAFITVSNPKSPTT